MSLFGGSRGGYLLLISGFEGFMKPVRQFRRFRRWPVVGLLGAWASVSACPGSPTGPESSGVARTIDVTPDPLRVPEGRSVQLIVVARDSIGTPIPNPELTYATLDAEIATVSPDGEVAGVGEGETRILVTSGNVAADVDVTVVDGAILASTPLGARPFGVDVGAGGTSFITRLDAATVSRIDLPDPDVSGAIAVGTVPTAVAFHPNGQEAYVTNQFDQDVGIIDAASNTQTTVIPIAGDPFMVAVSPDGTRLVVTANSNTVSMVDLTSRQVVATVPVGEAPNGVAFHPTQPVTYVSSFVGGSVAEISLQSNAVLRTFTVGGRPQGLAISADGSELYIANEQLGLQVWSIASGTSLATVGVGGGAFGLALSPDNVRLMVTGGSSGRVTVVARASRQILETIQTGGVPRRVAFNGAGDLVVVANEAGWVDILSN